MALATVAQVKTHLGITDSDSDAVLTQLLAIAEKATLNFLGRAIEQAAYTEYYSGNGHRDLCPKNWPISTAGTVRVYVDPLGAWGDNASGFDSTTELTRGTAFAVANDESSLGLARMIRRLGYGTLAETFGRPYGTLAARGRYAVWPHGDGNIKVVYTGGFATVPDDIMGAVIQMTATLFATKQFGGQFIASERLGEYSQTLTSALTGDGPLADVVGSYAFLLRPYKDYPV